jgi:tetratricopeptide (TPR) repeat protein
MTAAREQTDSPAIQSREGNAVPDTLRHALREARQAYGMTFRKFALQAGFSESHLRSVENGHRAVTGDIAAAYDRILETGGAFALVLEQPAGPAPGAGVPLAWDQAGTLAVLSGLASGGDVERRTFVTASGITLTVAAARWRSALHLAGPVPGTGSRQVPPSLVEHIDQRLEHLRHLDDEAGSGSLARLARGELAFIARLLRDASYSGQTAARLYSLAAEASRQAAWDYFDQGQHAVAGRYFETALRASATGGDPVAGAYALSFMAVQSYSTGRPYDAVSLLETARDSVARLGSARMTAMLAARQARAVSKTGNRKACARLLNQARDSLDAGPRDADPTVLYWVTHGEIEMIAASSALDLGDPAQAVLCFDAAIAADYRGDDQYPRSHAIYLARAAEAHLARRDLDAALDRAVHAVRCLGGVDSARSASALAGLRAKLKPHAASPRVRDFLEATRRQG